MDDVTQHLRLDDSAAENVEVLVEEVGHPEALVESDGLFGVQHFHVVSFHVGADVARHPGLVLERTVPGVFEAVEDGCFVFSAVYTIYKSLEPQSPILLLQLPQISKQVEFKLDDEFVQHELIINIHLGSSVEKVYGC